MSNEDNDLENDDQLDEFIPNETQSDEGIIEEQWVDTDKEPNVEDDLSGMNEAIETSDNKQEDSTFVKVLKEVLSWVKVILFALILTFLLNRFVLFNFTVPTESMENTIMVDNKIMSFRCAYLFSDPKRGDIIVFPFPDNPEETYIKRVIGLPGETIEGKDGLVYINGTPLEEDYVTSDLDEDFGPYEIPEESYFVLGDNRDLSKDARYWENKFVKKDDIISKAVLRFYPGIKALK